jgi:hypothetical protein
MKRGRILFGILGIVLVLLLNLLAASPSLHEWFHADANHADHQCAVTMFTHGQVDNASVAVAAALPVTSIETTPQIAFSVLSATVELLPSGRAPPLALASLV